MVGYSNPLSLSMCSLRIHIIALMNYIFFLFAKWRVVFYHHFCMFLLPFGYPKLVELWRFRVPTGKFQKYFSMTKFTKWKVVFPRFVQLTKNFKWPKTSRVLRCIFCVPFWTWFPKNIHPCAMNLMSLLWGKVVLYIPGRSKGLENHEGFFT